MKRLDRADGLHEATVEPLLPGGARAQPDGQSENADFDDSAERILIGLSLLDCRDHGIHGVGIGRVRLIDVARGPQRVRAGFVGHACRDPTDVAHETDAGDAEFAQEDRRQRPGRNAGRGLAGGGPLKDLAAVGREPFQSAGQVGMARPRAGDVGRLVDPVIPVCDL